jgi:hypothetical protein
VNKTVTGRTRARDFGFTVDCRWTPQGGVPMALDLSEYRDGSVVPDGVAATTAVFRLANGGAKILAVPTGSMCAVNEFDSGRAARTTYVVSGGANRSSITVGGDTAVQVTNAFSGSGALAFTGANLLRLLVAASVLIAVGVVGRIVGRRRSITA